MECKYCGAELDESVSVCPCCGGNLEEDSFAEDTAEIAIPIDDAVNADLVQPSNKRKPWQIILAVGCCIVLIASLVLIVLKATGYLDTNGGSENESTATNDQNNSDEDAAKSGRTVVAKMGDRELTNGELQVFYTQQVYEYVQYYGSVLSYIGLDVSKPFAEQTCMLDESLNWQQYFVNIAVQTWQRHMLLNMLAEEENITLPDYEMEKLNAIPSDTEEMAKQYNFESADAFLKATYGANVDMEAYVSYLQILYLSNYFYSYKSLALIPLSADIDAYYEEHKEDFASSGITKESGPIVDVRHLLVQPEGGEKDESNKMVYTEAAWNRALEEAKSLLNEWKSGAADQESFAALATKYTDDEGSKANGGLYQNVTKTSNYVEPFLMWALDEARKPGDTEIVKTDFGYHIMYFVNGEPQWFMAARTQLLSERMNEIIESAADQWPIEVKNDAISIYANDIVK